MNARRITLVGVLVIACLIRASVGEPGVHAAPAAPTLWWNVAYVGRDVVDLKWYPELGDLGYKITRDGDLIAELGAAATFFRDTEPLPGVHTYTLYRVTASGDQPDGADTVTLGAIEGMLYQDLTWSSGTYDVAVNVEVMPGVTLSIGPGVKVSAKTQTFHPHGLFGAGVLDIEGAVLDLTDLWVQGDGSTIMNSEFLPGFHSINVDADTRLEGNVFNSALYFDFGETAEVDMIGNTLKGGIVLFRAMDQAALTMERNVFSQPASGEIVLSLGSTAPAVVSDNRFEGCPYLDGVLQVNGSGAVTIRDNAFRCTDSNRYSALAIKVNANNSGIMDGNVFEGPYRYGGSNDAAAIEINAGAGIAVEDNLFHEWPVAVRVNGGAGALTANTFFNNGWANGLVVDGDGGMVLRDNCILSALEITNRTTPLDAKLNWWGDPSGPFHDDNLGGEGWPIDGGPVNFDPWLTDEADASCNVVDLTLAGAEVVQSVQSLVNSVPLVAEKAALMRIYADSAAGSVSSVPVVVRGYRDGGSLGVRAALVDAAPVRDVDAVRGDPNGGATIELPGTWLTGTVTLVTEINPDRSPSEIRYDNNVLTQTINFEPRRSMRLAYVPVTYAPEADSATTPTAGNVPKLHTTMARLYPLPGVDYAIWSPLTWPLEMSDATDEEEEERADLVVGLLTLKLAIFNASRPAGEQMDQIFGYFPGGTLGFCYSDPPWDGGRGVASYCADGGMWMAHEIGHNLGLRHPNTDDSGGADDRDTYWPYPTAEIQEVGYDVPDDQVKPSSYFDVMSYRDASEQWISPLHYQMLFEALPEPEVIGAGITAQASTTYLLISGQVTTGDSVTFQPIWQVEASSPPVNPSEGTAYCVEMRDGGGSVLQSQCFDLSFFNHETGQDVVSDFFMVSLPLDAAAASIVLTHGAEDLGAIGASANPPQVTLLAPSGGESLGESVTVEWMADDLDGDDLAYNVLYSADGVSWEPLALNVTGTTSLELDLGLAAGSDGGRFRVEASDGFHTAYDESDLVTVGNRSPLVAIAAPTAGFTATGTVTLEGAAYDPEDGPLTGASLAWASDQDGPLGTGERLEGVTLSGGSHVLTLEATDSHGQSSAATVSVNLETAVGGLTATNDGPTTLGEETAFSASVTEGTNVTYDWEFGDGGSGQGKDVVHTYTVTGTFTATVTASNEVNAVTATTVAVVISESESPDGHSIYLPLVIRR